MDHSSRDSDRRRWLCIAYAFPPMQRSGTHRTLSFVKHLSELGWDATVLTVETEGEPTDDSLVQDIPPSTTIVRTRWVHPIVGMKSIYQKVVHRVETFILFKKSYALLKGIKWGWHGQAEFARAYTLHGQTSLPMPPGECVNREVSKEQKSNKTEPRARQGASSTLARARHRSQRCGMITPAAWIKDWVSRLLMIPDSRIGWIPFAVIRGFKTIKNEKPSVIYSTSPYMSAHLIALILSQLTHTAWVADFRDPWNSNPYRDLRFRSLERWDALLEWLVLRYASNIVCNTPTMTKLLCRRRPFVTRKCSTILNGIDPERFTDIKPKRIVPTDDFILAHCGQFYGPRSPLVWFDALRHAIEKFPQINRNIHLLLLGPDQYEGQSLHKLAVKAGIGDHVHILGTKSHAETLSLMAGSDALILAGCDGIGGELQVPNKLFEYLAVRKPILAGISAANPSIHILREARAPALICYPNNEYAIANAIVMLAAGQLNGIKNAWSGVERFERKHRAVELADLFQQLCMPSTARKERGIRSTIRSFAERFRKRPATHSGEVVSTGVAS